MQIKHPNQLAGDYICTLVEYDAKGRPHSHDADITVTSLPKYKNHFYYLSQSSNLSHDEANDKCHQLGGYLVEINDNDEGKALNSEIIQQCNVTTYGSWGGPVTFVRCPENYMKVGAKYDTVSRSWKFMTSGGHMDNVYARVSGDPQNSCLYKEIMSMTMPYYAAACDWERETLWMCEIPEPATGVVELTMTGVNVVG